MNEAHFAVTIEGLRRSFAHVDAVAGIDLQVARGEIVALLGPNGAGKTTTLQCIANILRPSAGRVVVNGVANAADCERHVAYVPEVPLVYPDLTPREHLAFVAAVRRIGEPAIAVERALQRVGITSFADRPAGTLSKGTRQRLCLAGAIVAGVGVLLLDEPSSGLDPAAQRALCETLRDLAAGGAAILMSTHALDIAFGAATRILTLVGGRIRAELSPAAFPDAAALGDAYLRAIAC